MGKYILFGLLACGLTTGVLAWAFLGGVITVPSDAVQLFGEQITPTTEMNKWGAFGSYIGGVLGPAFSFLAFIMLTRTFQLQREIKTSDENKRKQEQLEFELNTAETRLDKMDEEVIRLLDASTSEEARGLNHRMLLKVALETDGNQFWEKPEIDDERKQQVKISVSAVVQILTALVRHVKEVAEQRDALGIENEKRQLTQQYWRLRHGRIARECMNAVSHMEANVDPYKSGDFVVANNEEKSLLNELILFDTVGYKTSRPDEKTNSDNTH